jgi:hypothetical protein
MPTPRSRRSTAERCSRLAGPGAPKRTLKTEQRTELLLSVRPGRRQRSEERHPGRATAERRPTSQCANWEFPSSARPKRSSVDEWLSP